MKYHRMQIYFTIFIVMTEHSLSILVPIDPDSPRNVSELITSKGYPVENYEVNTKDNYVLGIQRIPRGKNENLDAPLSNKTAVLLLHGMMGASHDYVLNSANESLGFILADAGYDVWMGNFRGTIYSSHKTLTRNDREFWEFSTNELAAEDLPATIDTVLEKSGQTKIQYIGLSQGGLAMVALLSEKPEYNAKISLFSGMAPAVYLGHFRAPMRLLVPILPLALDAWKAFSKGKFFDVSPSRLLIANSLCGGIIGNELCAVLIFLLQGLDTKQLNKTRLPVYISHDPAGSSTDNFKHIIQLIQCNCFRKFDYGPIMNLVKYGKTSPPDYVVSRTQIPVALYWSKGDQLVTEQDVARLRKELPNVVEYYQVPDEQFTHIDYGLGINAEAVVYRKMMSVMENYRT